ncbi:hypothetical protein N8611_01525 [bacterium]|nr:hypothetical protein [bacterium]
MLKCEDVTLRVVAAMVLLDAGPILLSQSRHPSKVIRWRSLV